MELFVKFLSDSGFEFASDSAMVRNSFAFNFFPPRHMSLFNNAKPYMKTHVATCKVPATLDEAQVFFDLFQINDPRNTGNSPFPKQKENNDFINIRRFGNPDFDSANY